MVATLSLYTLHFKAAGLKELEYRKDNFSVRSAQQVALHHTGQQINIKSDHSSFHLCFSYNTE